MAEIPIFSKYLIFRLHKVVFAYYPQEPTPTTRADP